MRATSLKSKSLKRTGKSDPETPLESSTNPHKPAKKGSRNRVPPPQRERILQKFTAGKNIKDISSEENLNRETVSKIVKGPEIQTLVHAMREKWFNLAPAAIGAVEDALKNRKDGRLGFQLLATTGVIPSPEETKLLATPPLEPEEEEAQVRKWMMYLVEATIERAHIYGMQLPEFDALLKRISCRINYTTGKIEPIKKEVRDLRNGEPTPEWQKPYQDLILEFDRERLLDKVEKVHTLISERQQQLAEANEGHDEQAALSDALSTIQILTQAKLGVSIKGWA
jgi:hypothetical protein